MIISLSVTLVAGTRPACRQAGLNLEPSGLPAGRSGYEPEGRCGFDDMGIESGIRECVT